MDRDAAPDPRVLPALLVLHTEFEQTYHRHLATDDPFWELLRAATYTGAETASRDAGLDGITRSQFIEICAKKTVGVTVPLAAVACRAGRPDASRPWFDLVERFGRWHQMLNDIRDWARDLALGRRTYFLSEAARRSPGAPAVWVLREGIAWGAAELDAWMTDAIDAAAGLGSPPLLAYLEGRKADADREWREVMETLSTLERQLVSRGADSQHGSGSARPGD
jgi:hypothetical protein